jgi:tRNA modification GTPase
LAGRGEFTLRAFLNGALSLDEAEAVADLISAKTSQAAQMAARQLQGAVSSRLAPLEQELLAILARMTVGVDFPDDADAPAAEELLPQLAALRQHIAELLAGAASGRIYREGYRAVLAGATNVGKSSLLNRLLQTERAIVSAEAGTTRDLIEEAIDLEGLPLLLTDTAGLREEAELTDAEAQGMERSRVALAAAQLLLIVIDVTQGIEPAVHALLNIGNLQCCLVLNKADLVTPKIIEALLKELAEQYPAYAMVVVSAKTGAGVDELLAKIKGIALTGLADAGREPLLNNIRHQQALLRADAALSEAMAALTGGLPPDLAIIDLENAYHALGEISGKTVSEEVLSSIFANFCVGK